MKKSISILICFLILMTIGVAYAEATETNTVMTVDLTQIIMALLALLGSLITAKLIPWIQANTNEKQQRILSAAVYTAVYAAEQLYGAGNGKEKLMYAKNQLAKKGYTIDIDEIESAVRGLTMLQEQDTLEFIGIPEIDPLAE